MNRSVQIIEVVIFFIDGPVVVVAVDQIIIIIKVHLIALCTVIIAGFGPGSSVKCV